MKRSLPSILLKILGGIAILLLLCFGGLVAWVVTGPRSLDAFTPYIESALIPPGSGYKVKIGGTMLIWDGVTHPIGIRVRDLDIIDGKNVTLAHFPDVGLKLYVFRLLEGVLDVKSVELLGPVVKLVQNEKGDITSFGFSNPQEGKKDDDNSIPVALTLFTAGSDDNPVSRLQEFIVRDASLSVLDAAGNIFLASSSASLEITRKSRGAKGRFRMPLTIMGNSGDIDITFTLDGKSRETKSDVIFSEIPSAVLHKLAPSQEWMGGVQVPLSGWAKITSDFDAHIGAIDFSLEAGQGIIDFPGQFDEPFNIDHIKCAGKLTQQLTLLDVTQAELTLNGHSLSFKGSVKRQGDDVGVDGTAETADIMVDDLHRYWPLKLSPHARRWVVSHLSKGKATRATAVMHFKPGDFRLKDTPQNDIDATIAVSGATIVYKAGDPPITDINGTVRFTGKTMDAKITGAKYLSGAHVTSARARFPNFYPDDVEMTIEMEMEAPARDVQRFLSLPKLNKAARINLTQDVKGDAKGNAKLDFIAFSENDIDDVGGNGKITYSVNADLIHVSQKKFLGNRDVDDANMKLLVDNKGLKISGAARINGVPMQLAAATSLGKSSDTTYSVKTDMPVAKLPAFGLPKLDFVTGSIGADASFVSSDTADKATATLDLNNADIELPQHGFVKKAGKQATLKIATEHKSSGNTLIKSFTLTEGKQTASGNAEFDHKTGDFKTFSFSPLRIGQNDLDTLTYERAGNTLLISAEGRVFDATPYIDSKSSGGDLGYVVDLKANKVILGEGREISDVTVNADCPADACRKVHIKSKLSDGAAFTYSITDGTLLASCDDAGELARTLAVFDTIEGGALSMKGSYTGGKLEGLLSVKDYRLRKAPVMTKIFTIASLTGIVNTLSGNGIYFSKLSAPFIYHRGIVQLKEARGHGDALGFTADGIIDTNDSTLDLKGVLVPSYTLNSLVGNIPLIGNLITGGPGTGLVALTYGIHGSMKDPSVHVNPLSVITPGFLRDIFNIFDKKAPDIDSIEKAEKEAQDEKAVTPVVTTPETGAPATATAKPGSTLPSLEELQK